MQSAVYVVLLIDFLMKTRNTDRECVKEDEIWSLQKLMTVLNAADAEVELRHGANINYRIFGIDEEPLLWKNPLYTQTITKYNMKAIAREAADGCEMMGMLFYRTYLQWCFTACISGIVGLGKSI